jgi:hypothetical protein
MVEQSKPFIFSAHRTCQHLHHHRPTSQSILRRSSPSPHPVPGWFARRGVSVVLTFVLTSLHRAGLLLVFFGLAVGQVLPSIQAGVTAEGELLTACPAICRLDEIRDAATAS